MSLTYKPFSEFLHISVKHLFESTMFSFLKGMAPKPTVFLQKTEFENPGFQRAKKVGGRNLVDVVVLDFEAVLLRHVPHQRDRLAFRVLHPHLLHTSRFRITKSMIVSLRCKQIRGSSDIVRANLFIVLALFEGGKSKKNNPER